MTAPTSDNQRGEPSGLRYLERGEGEPVLLLHGLGGRGTDWSSQLDALAPHFRVIAPDLRGHGASAGSPGPWQMRDLAEDVATLLERLGVRSAHVAGLSLGGMIAFHLAVDFPALVRSAVIINSGPAFPGNTWQGRLLLWTRLATIRFRGLAALGRPIAGRLFPNAGQQALRDAFVAQFVQNTAAHYVSTLKAIGTFDLSARLGEVRCPLLALSGDRDYTPVSAKEVWVRQIAGATLQVIADSGHASPVDQPDAVNQALLSFWGAQR